MAAGKGFDAFEAKMLAKGIPPNIIQIIMQVIMALIGNCPTPTVASIRKRPIIRARIAVGIRQHQPMPFSEAFKYADAAFDVADDADDSVVQGFIHDCCQ